MDLLEPSSPSSCLDDVDQDDYTKSTTDAADFDNDPLWYFLVDDEVEEAKAKAPEDDEADSSYTGSPEDLRAEMADQIKTVPVVQPTVVRQLAAAKSEAALAEVWPEQLKDDDDDDSVSYACSPTALSAEIAQEMNMVRDFGPAVVHQLTVARSAAAIVELWTPTLPSSKAVSDSSSRDKPIFDFDVPGYEHGACKSLISNDVELEGGACSKGKPGASITSDSTEANGSRIDDHDTRTLDRLL